MKHLANIITLSRIVFALAMLCAAPFSALFWLCYCFAGLSDIIDGAVARKLGQQSAVGAKLDSLADLAFGVCIFLVVIKNLSLPLWLWLCGAIVALLRIIGYGIGFYKHHTFASLHTWLNKAAGALIFSFPLLYALVGLPAAGMIISLVAFVSAAEELLITITAKTLNRDCKGLFARNHNV